MRVSLSLLCLSSVCLTECQAVDNALYEHGGAVDGRASFSMARHSPVQPWPQLSQVDMRLGTRFTLRLTYLAQYPGSYVRGSDRALVVPMASRTRSHASYSHVVRAEEACCARQ